LLESIRRGGGKSMTPDEKASGPPAESGKDAPGKRGMVNGESEDEQSGKMRRGFAVFIYLRAWRKIFPGAAVVWSVGRSRARKSRVE
jgi:hypothetical protein